MSNAADLAKIEQAEKELAQLEGQYSDIVAEAGLAGASMLPPPAGTAADIASLVVSLSKGNWGDALIDAVGFIPIGGDAVKAAIKGPKIVAKKKDIQAAIDATRVKLAQKKLALKTDPKELQKKTAEACKNGSKQKCSGGTGNSEGVNGGAHRQTTKPVGDGKDSHHMPDRNADQNVHPNDGMAIKMDPKDHAVTSSNGRMPGSKEYRATNKEMIEAGKKRDVMVREIKDVRRASQQVSGNRSKYNQGMQEMLDYGKKSGQIPPKPK